MALGILVSRGRCALVGAGVTAAAAAVGAGLAPVLGEAVAAARAGHLADTRFDVALVWGCASVTVAVTCWLWLVAVLVLLDVARGAVRPRGAVPTAVRHAVVVLCGAALTTGLAAPTWADAGPPGAEVLRGLQLPERVAVDVAPRAPRASPPASVPLPVGTTRTVVVGPGDTLWALAAAELGPDPAPALVARAWPRLYARNRAVIGADPGHLEPGQRLVLPPVGAPGSTR